MMGPHGHVSYIFIIFAVLTATFAVDPGVKMRVTEKGITYANSIAEAAIRNQLQTLRIEDQSGKDGKLSWSLTNIQIEEVTGPTTQIRLNPETGGLTFVITNFGIKLRSDWRASYKLLFKIRASGSVNVDVGGSSLSITVSLGEQNGRPSVTSSQCSSNIGNVNVKFHGGFAAFILNIFKGAVGNKVRSLLQSKVCDIVARVINSNANEELAKMKVHVAFARRFFLDYGLVAAPVVTSNYLETLHKGVVYWNDNKQESPFSPGAIPAWDDVNNMLYVFLTEYTPNTFAYTAHTNEYLKYNLTINDLPLGHLDLLNATPQVGTVYPNSWLELKISSKAVPTVKMENQNLTVWALGEVEVVAHTDNSATTVFTLSVNLLLTVQPSIVNEKLTAIIVHHSFDVNILKSDIADLDLQELKPLLENVLTFVIIPEVNKIGSNGIDLPIAGDVRFYNTKLNVLPGALVVSTDLQYK